MKNKSASLIVLFTLILAATSASAFYDPGTQRWLTRDPLGDPAFEAISPDFNHPNLEHLVFVNQNRLFEALRVRSGQEGLSPYRFAANRPSGAWDPNGLEIGIEYPPGGGGRDKPPDVDPGRIPSNCCRIGCAALGTGCGYACWRLFSRNPVALALCVDACALAAIQCWNMCPDPPN